MQSMSGDKFMKELFGSFDSNGDGRVDFQEFSKWKSTLDDDRI